MHVHSFWWGPNIGEFLFQGLKVNSTGGLVLLCIILACLSIFFELIKVSTNKIDLYFNILIVLFVGASSKGTCTNGT